MRPDGTILTCKRGKPKLANDAVPARFPSLFAVFNKKGNPVKIPSYATKKSSQARADPAEPRAKMDAVQRARQDEKKKLLEIKTFAQLQSCFAKIQLPKSWRLWETESEMHVYQPISIHVCAKTLFNGFQRNANDSVNRTKRKISVVDEKLDSSARKIKFK